MAMANKWAGAALVAALVATGGAAAALGKGKAPDFATLDANGDGQITQAELRAAGEARFTATDTDGNGALSAEELIRSDAERAAERVTRMIERFDTNGDGELSLAEMPRRGGKDRGAKMFERFDANGDGAISETEFEAMREARAEHAARHGKHGQAKNGQRDTN